MNLQHYEINSTEDLNTYVFVSSGRNGDIFKIVQFTHIQSESSSNRYNLALGDWIDGRVEDTPVTNNGDVKTVMATIGEIVTYYTQNFPEREIFAAGSTRNRSRLYQMLISNNLAEIERNFEVFGIKYLDQSTDELESHAGKFEKTETYGAVLVIRK